MSRGKESITFFGPQMQKFRLRIHSMTESNNIGTVLLLLLFVYRKICRRKESKTVFGSMQDLDPRNKIFTENYLTIHFYRKNIFRPVYYIYGKYQMIEMHKYIQLKICNLKQKNIRDNVKNYLVEKGKSTLLKDVLFWY